MKIAKKLPIVRVQDALIHLEYLVCAWYDEEQSYANHWVVTYRMFNDTESYSLIFRSRKAALGALDTILTAVDIPLIDEDED